MKNNKCKHENVIAVHNSIGNTLTKECQVRCKDCKEVLYQSQNKGIEQAYDFIEKNKSSYKTLMDYTCDLLNERFDIADGFEM